MKKYISVMLALVLAIGLGGCSSGVSQEEHDKIVSENEELKKEVENLKSSVNEATGMLQKYIDAAEDDIMSSVPLMMYEATATMLNENATCVEINDSVVQITVPLTDLEDVNDYEDKLKAAAYSIAIALDEEGYSTCIIMFIDKIGNCVAGFSCGIDRDVTAFTGTGT